MLGPRRKQGERPTAATESTAAARASGRAHGPLWRNISRSLEKDIVAGRLAAGSKLPTETTLSRQFGVNRHTLRRAIADLTKKGLLRHVAKSGTFVAPLRIPFPLSPVSRISEAIESAGFTPSSRLLSQRISTPPPRIAHQLAVAERTAVIELTLVRLANDIPICYVTAWLPADRFEGIGKLFELTCSLRQAIVKMGVPKSFRKLTRIVSRVGDNEECDQLALERGTTLLTLEVVDVDPADEPIAVFLYRFSALRTEFVIER